MDYIIVKDFNDNKYTFLWTPKTVLRLIDLPQKECDELILSLTMKKQSKQGKKSLAIETLMKLYNLVSFDTNPIYPGSEQYELEIIKKGKYLNSSIAYPTIVGICKSPLIIEGLLSPLVSIKIYSEDQRRYCVFLGGYRECDKVNTLQIENRRAYTLSRMRCFYIDNFGKLIPY